MLLLLLVPTQEQLNVVSKLQRILMYSKDFSLIIGICKSSKENVYCSSHDRTQEHPCRYWNCVLESITCLLSIKSLTTASFLRSREFTLFNKNILKLSVTIDMKTNSQPTVAVIESSKKDDTDLMVNYK